jgi:hypothetical protein
VLLARYRELLSGRVLELGCGADRLLDYFLTLSGRPVAREPFARPGADALAAGRRRLRSDRAIDRGEDA